VFQRDLGDKFPMGIEYVIIIAAVGSFFVDAHKHSPFLIHAQVNKRIIVGIPGDLDSGGRACFSKTGYKVVFLEFFGDLHWNVFFCYRQEQASVRFQEPDLIDAVIPPDDVVVSVDLPETLISLASENIYSSGPSRSPITRSSSK